jgi:hypothetical protein
MRWVIRSEPMHISIEGHMHDMISLGVGHLKAVVRDQTFDPEINYPVYIAEPLTILTLSSLFEKRGLTERKTWMVRSAATARDKSSLGSIYEEMIMFVLMDKFGGKFTRLDEVFHFGESMSLGSREVTLVSLARSTGDEMASCEASWSAGGSDRFGFKAHSPDDVLAFLKDPKGKAFLLPDNHMGPDVICFFQDKETQELILVVLQAKSTPTLDSGTWLKALNSVMPEFFYTVMVCARSFNLCLSDGAFIFALTERRRKTRTVCSGDIPRSNGECTWFVGGDVRTRGVQTGC